MFTVLSSYSLWEFLWFILMKTDSATGSHQPQTKQLTWAVSLPAGYCCPQPLFYYHLFAITQPESWKVYNANISKDRKIKAAKPHTRAVSEVTLGQPCCESLQANRETSSVLSPILCHELFSLLLELNNKWDRDSFFTLWNLSSNI